MNLNEKSESCERIRCTLLFVIETVSCKKVLRKPRVPGSFLRKVKKNKANCNDLKFPRNSQYPIFLVYLI